MRKISRCFNGRKRKKRLSKKQQKHQEQEALILEKELLLQKAEQAEKVSPYLEQHALACQRCVVRANAA